MLDWTDRHCRYLFRLISKKAILYTEMVTAGAIIHGDRDRHLLFNQEEHPVALQLGGSAPDELVQALKIAESYGYDEYNLNCGCPSDRVQNGAFGACMMLTPQLVSDCLKAMTDTSGKKNISLKCRIGVDEQDSYEAFSQFIHLATRDSQIETVIVHARKAWLKGLSPKQNREIPPLHYDYVYQLKKDFPDLDIIINGGITNIAAGLAHLEYTDGVMVGREAYQNPWLLDAVDTAFYQQPSSSKKRCEVYMQFMDYCETEMSKGVKLHHMTRHVLNLFNGQAGAKQFRRHISENAWRENASLSVMQDALNKLLAQKPSFTDTTSGNQNDQQT
ncbi:MAG: tRNA dihydrouridine(20/20a) synthase DusA [Pseudomonadales bacterium]|nr:tRNA dihydrouridine(20/20a) synthase DusA [Pseudomonadales bacterium]